MSGRYHQAAYLKPSGNANDGISPPNPDKSLDGGSTSTVAAAMTTQPVWVHNLDALSIQFSTQAGATLVGTLTLQGSNDRGNLEQTGQADVKLINWTTISFVDMSTGAVAASKAIASGAQTFLLALGGPVPVTFRWLRLVVAFTSGTAPVTAALQQKGWA